MLKNKIANDSEADACHILTSFGHTIDANVLVRRQDVNLAITLHGYANGARVFPGLEGEMLDVPVKLGGHALTTSPRLEAKTAGWVASVPYLDRNLTVRLGIQTRR